MHQANKIRNTLIRIWGILSLVVVMGYSVLGWHHHVGVHVCLAYEHLFLDGLCIYDVCDRGHHIPSGQIQPVPFETHHQGHSGHSCKCSVEYFSAINREQTAKVIRQIRQLSPIWALLALIGVLLAICRKSVLPDSCLVVRLLPPPLLSGQGLRAPPFLFF